MPLSAINPNRCNLKISRSLNNTVPCTPPMYSPTEPVNGYIVPCAPAHQNNSSFGNQVEAESASILQVACMGKLSNIRDSGNKIKANVSSSQVGSHSLR